VQVRLWGVRGSRPTAGPEYVRYGGDTSCVAISRGGGPPSIVLDAGTGLSRLGAELAPAPFDGTILLTHLHWDHVYGIPFFPAGDRPDARVDLRIPAQGDAEAVLAGSMGPPHFPIRPSQLRGRWTFAGLEAGAHVIEGFTVLALDIPHAGGRTFGYRVSDGRASIAYLPDHGPVAFGAGPRGLGYYHEAARELAEGVDLLIHDAQYTTEEFAERSHYGHSAIDYAIGLGEEAGARRVVLFHHDPDHTDDVLDGLAPPPGRAELAVQGSVFLL